MGRGSVQLKVLDLFADGGYLRPDPLRDPDPYLRRDDLVERVRYIGIKDWTMFFTRWNQKIDRTTWMGFDSEVELDRYVGKWNTKKKEDPSPAQVYAFSLSKDAVEGSPLSRWVSSSWYEEIPWSPWSILLYLSSNPFPILWLIPIRTVFSTIPPRVLLAPDSYRKS